MQIYYLLKIINNISENNLIINFDDLCEWLNMRKDNMKKTLIRSYTKDIDYKINVIKLISKRRNIYSSRMHEKNLYDLTNTQS